VDTGSELSSLPAEVLAGFVTNDEVVFASPGDMHLLGVRTLEGFGVMVDPFAHRLAATITLAASNPPSRE
jgi:hypothetical protein